MAAPRYRFGDFTISPARRLLLRSGRELPLIPRYFDLLVLLIESRHRAVGRQEILDAVWNDVVVSDGALSQAVRTLRRTLGDDVREPIFIRTVSRHGYRFVWGDVVEEPDDAEPAAPPPAPPGPPVALPVEDPFDAPLRVLLGPGTDEDARREAAETLHALGTEETLRRLDRRPGYERARAFLRDTRWDTPGAGRVPLLSGPGGGRAALVLIGLRLRRGARLAGSRWAAASGGGAVAGIISGLLGGLVLMAGPGSTAPPSLPIALAVVGLAIGGLGAAGVGAGLAMAEALARSMRGAALVVCGALGGGVVGAVAHLVGRWTIEDLFGRQIAAVGGGFEGMVLGGAAGLGYALSTSRPGGGMASPRGVRRLSTALVTGVCCAVAGVALTWTRGHLVGVSLDFMSHTFEGSRVELTPLARMLGEQAVGPATRTLLSAWEGLMFGAGLVLGLTRRPGRDRRAPAG